MVITCPSCSARYRLNPDKIKGRGAKITCPKCSHVFVVFADASTGAADAEPEAPAPAPPSPPKRPSPPPAADMPEQPSGRFSETTSGAFQAVGLDEDDVASTTGSIRVVAPGPRKTRRVRALSRDNLPTTKQIGGTGEVATEDESDEPAPLPKSASDLDFRSVGITTWKVKVSIGLIYDFSDISTLKKYLADKKVTEDDLISHNAKDWTRIGEIESLDQHFIDTWTAAKAAGASEAPKKERKPDPTSTGSQAAVGTGSYATSTGSYGAQPTGRTGTHRTAGSEPVRAPSGRTSRKAAEANEAAADASRGRTRLLAGAAAAALLLGGGWFWMQGRDDGGAVIDARGGSPTPTDKAAEASQQERIQEAIREKLEREAAEIREREEALAAAARAVEDDARDLPLAERNLVAVRPENQTVTPDRPGQRSLTPMPAATPLPRATPAPTAAQSSTKQNSHLTYLKYARAKLAEGNFGSALKMVDTAIAKGPDCGECYATRAEIKQNMGDPAGAAADLARAKELGSASAGAGQ